MHPPDPIGDVASGIPGVAADAVTQSPTWLVIRPIRKEEERRAPG